MADATLRRLWKDVEFELSSAIENLVTLNPGANLKEANDFLAHNELLLACEQIEDAIDIQSLRFNDEVKTSVSKARRLMGVQSEEQSQ